MFARRTIALTALILLVPASAHAQGPRRATNGTIATTAGTVSGCCNDGGPATQGKLNQPRDIGLLPDGSVLIADRDNNRIRKIDPAGTITTVAGTGNAGNCCDEGPATGADLGHPRGLATLADGSYLIADSDNGSIRKVTPDGVIHAFANGFSQPSDIEPTADGGFLVADTGHQQIKKILPGTGISVVAGNGTAGFSGDGGPATAAQLSGPRDIAVASDGAILIADSDNHRVRRVGTDGVITTVAGGSGGFSGDGGQATKAQLGQVFGVTALSNGGFLVADTTNNRIRRVTPLGAIFTVAGGNPGLSGDGGQANTAQLTQPAAMTLLPGTAGFLVADTGNARIRRVTDVGAIPNAVVGRSVYVYPAGAGVQVAIPGVPVLSRLVEEDLVPIDTSADASTGTLEVRTAADNQGAQQTAQLSQGPFKIQQLGSAAAPTTLFRLPSLTDCGSTRRASTRSLFGRVTAFAAKATKKKRKRRGNSRRLFVTEKGGRWRSSTGSTSAAAVGTAWTTTLLCDGTRVTVKEGRVAVFDKLRNRTKVVSAGGTYKVLTPARFAGK